MAWARWSRMCDLYVYEHVDGTWRCVDCTLLDPSAADWAPEFVATSEAEMLAHVDEHRAAGHQVPAEVGP